MVETKTTSWGYRQDSEECSILTFWHGDWSQIPWRGRPDHYVAFMRFRRGAVAFITAGLLVAGCGSSGDSSGTKSSEGGDAASPLVDPLDSGDQFNTLDPVIVRTDFVPGPVATSDGLVHLTYEIQTTSLSREDTELESVAVMRPDSPTDVLIELTGEALEHATTVIGQRDATTTLAPGSTLVTYIDLVFDSIDDVPTEVDNAVATSGADHATIRRFRVSDIEVDTYGPPLRGAGWIAGEGCCSPPTHHRRGIRSINGKGVIPERFAIDFLQVVDGIAYENNGDANEDWFGWDAQVIAVADGVVASTFDGMATNDMVDPGELPSTVPEGGGNQVIIDHGNGQFSAYLHMQAGSLEVQEGDIVERGQLLGRLGNSGHSSAPHLHFQLGTANSIGSGEGLPFVFDEFELLGTFENGLIDAIPDAPGDQVAAVPPPVGPGVRTNELPLDVTLINFAD